MSDQAAESVILEGETIYAVSYPTAMCARDILDDRLFAVAMGYGWLHDEDTEFVRTFREQVRRQAEIYEQWLAGDEAEPCERKTA